MKCALFRYEKVVKKKCISTVYRQITRIAKETLSKIETEENKSERYTVSTFIRGEPDIANVWCVAAEVPLYPSDFRGGCAGSYALVSLNIRCSILCR